MGRTLLVPVQIEQNDYAVQPGDLTLTTTALSPFVLGQLSSDPVNGNAFAMTGDEILLVWNTDSVDHLFTALTVQDKLGRTLDLPYLVPASSLAVFEYSVLEGWQQADGNAYLNPSDPTLLFAVLVHS
jgi:hypothetical protein